MTRIGTLLTDPHRRTLLVPFFTAGYPNIATTAELVHSAVAAGADMIELGMPFSDPLADGPEIQFSSHEALRGGTSLAAILRLVAQIRAQCTTPVILMGYSNPILAFGTEQFFAKASLAGVDGLIIADLPIEEAGQMRRCAAQHDLSLIFLVAPTSAASRVRQVSQACTDLAYAVTVTGVTGTGKQFGRSTHNYLKRLRRTLGKPFVAGFGIDSPARAAELGRLADGVVVGSKLVKLLRESRSRTAGVRAVTRFLSDCRRALDR